MSPWDTIQEGFWFAIGFFFPYYAMEVIANKIPSVRRYRASRAAKMLRAVQSVSVTRKVQPKAEAVVEPLHNTDLGFRDQAAKLQLEVPVEPDSESAYHPVP